MWTQVAGEFPTPEGGFHQSADVEGTTVIGPGFEMLQEWSFPIISLPVSAFAARRALSVAAAGLHGDARLSGRG
jgi:hypothetical protein